MATMLWICLILLDFQVQIRLFDSLWLSASTTFSTADGCNSWYSRTCACKQRFITFFSIIFIIHLLVSIRVWRRCNALCQNFKLILIVGILLAMSPSNYLWRLTLHVSMISWFLLTGWFLYPTLFRIFFMLVVLLFINDIVILVSIIVLPQTQPLLAIWRIFRLTTLMLILHCYCY